MSNVKSVKVTLCDLPLHCVDNSQVLEIVSQHCTLLSPVQYGTLWHYGNPTSIKNGDRFFYIQETAAQKLPQTIDVGEYTARVFKPVIMMKCHRCGNTGHKSADLQFPAIALKKVIDMVETQGGRNQLSNLHNCPKGCAFKDGLHEFHSSEQHYQFQ